MQHVRGPFSSGTCKVDRRLLFTEVHEFDSVQCPLCEESFDKLSVLSPTIGMSAPTSVARGPDLEVCCDDDPSRSTSRTFSRRPDAQEALPEAPSDTD